MLLRFLGGSCKSSMVAEIFVETTLPAPKSHTAAGLQTAARLGAERGLVTAVLRSSAKILFEFLKFSFERRGASARVRAP